ncbi:MAG: EpsG family protein, partial [Oscillospiraceae bacterium]|nr:EpsG family protein [Oscillospiraceae bacterium]
ILTFCFYTTLNIIRQSIAVAIVFSANRFVINRKFMPYCVCVVFASLFHLTALVMIPAYFILIKPSWSNTTLITVIAAAVVFALFSVFQTSVIALAQNTRYGGMVGDNERGVSVIRVIFTVIPIIPAFIWRKILRKQEPYYDLIVNQYILASLITVISLKTVYLARISEYFYISILLLLPMYIKISKDRVKNALMCVVVVVFFGAFYVISLMTNVEDANLIPYQSVFSLPDNWAVADDIAVR